MAVRQTSNVDPKVVADFGKEWQAFNQGALTGHDLQSAFGQYFGIFPFEKINARSTGFDMGCGSGRWAKLMAPRVGHLHCVDPSAVALESARENLGQFSNCDFECASVSESRISDASQDFGYCLGVLHHIPDTMEGLRACARKLRSGAPFLLYLYYRFDNRPTWFKLVWKMSDLARRAVSSLPFPVKLTICQVIALSVYWPLSRTSLILENLGLNVSNIPLSDYRKKPLYTLRTDALDRFGTRLEKRFTQTEIKKMMVDAGFADIRFSQSPPFWVAVGTKL